MKTWSDYKAYVKGIDARAAQDIEDAEKLAESAGDLDVSAISERLIRENIAAYEILAHG